MDDYETSQYRDCCGGVAGSAFIAPIHTHTHTERSVAAFWLIARSPPPLLLFISAKPVHVVTPTLRNPHLIRREDDDSSPSGEMVGDDRRSEGVGPNHASDVSAVFVASDSSTLQPTHTHTHTVNVTVGLVGGMRVLNAG